MRSSARGLTTATLALAGALSLSVAGPHRAYAAPGQAAAQADSNLAITVLSPTPRTNFSGNKPIEVSAFYQGSDLNEITALELYVDGSSAFTKRLDAPEARGVISFLIDASQLSAGPHSVVVRAIAADAEVVSAKSSFIYIVDQQNSNSSQPQIDTSAAPTAQSSLPELSYTSPSMDEQVRGTVKISLKASEPNGKSPYVSLFIDRTFKTLRNYAPYEYDWDTTAYSNGYHTIEAYGYDENQNVGPAQIVRVYVNNPGGRTEVRKDLKDGIPAKPEPTSRKTAKLSSPYVPVGSAETKAVHSAVPTIPIEDAPALAKGQKAVASTRRPSLKPLQIAKLSAISERISGDSITLSDPFVSTSGAPVGAKTIGAARRPSPRMAMLDSALRFASLRPVMLAKRNVLDETGGLHSTTDLSDPYIPDTTSPKPATHAALTPTTGFKPMPSTSAPASPALAKAEAPKASTKAAPALIGRDAHTVPAPVAAPEVIQPVLDMAVKTVGIEVAAPATKTVKIHTPAAPVAKHVAAHVATAPVAKVVAVHTPAAPVAKHVQAHTPIVAAHPSKLKVHSVQPPVHKVAVHIGGASLLKAKGEMKVYFNHTSLMLDRPIAPREGVMFSPLRQIFEFEGGSLTWQRQTGEVHAQSETKNIMLHIGDKKATINNEQTTLEMAPYLDEGRTMVPLSFLPMALDVNVQFDQTSGHLLITTKN